MITIRVQGKEGLKRVQVKPDDTIKSLFNKIQNAFEFNSTEFTLFKDRQLKQSLNSSSSSKTLRIVSDLGIGHGDIIYLNSKQCVSNQQQSHDGKMDTAVPSTSKAYTSQANENNSKIRKVSVSEMPEDEIDTILTTKNGLIKRPKDPKLCRHNDNASCIFCAPLEPYDEAYLREKNIKHLSFHSYLRKLTSGVDKGKFAALEDINVAVKGGCTTHLPWPAGICSNCQPSAVTLNRQIYRHVDNVMFENPHIVDRFLSSWRSTAQQRVGFMYGKYEENSDVPLGIRARVCAIFEPPQEGTKDSIDFSLSNDEQLRAVNDIAQSLGLKCIGWIFTDLVPKDISKGTVRHIRGIHSHFLSAQECITAGFLQNLHPNHCKLAPKGSFGSKFATVLVTGDDKEQVHMVSYQVSNQCMALVREKCLIPTKDAPELGYIKESNEEKYIPDVFYKEKDEYGNEVSRLARPLPVEYLLVDVPVSTPKEPEFTFSPNIPEMKSFPIANRNIVEDGQVQDFSALASYLRQFPPNTQFIDKARDFHFLIYISTQLVEIYDLRPYIGPLLEAIRDGDEAKATDWEKSQHWATVEQLVDATMN